MLGEEPSDINWYAFFISLIVVFNVCFVYISEQKKQLRDANGGLVPHTSPCRLTLSKNRFPLTVRKLFPTKFLGELLWI